MFGFFKKYEMSTVDLEVIEILKKEGIELTEVKKFLHSFSDSYDYIVKKGYITELRICNSNKIIDENILDTLSRLTKLEVLELYSN